MKAKTTPVINTQLILFVFMLMGFLLPKFFVTRAINPFPINRRQSIFADTNKRAPDFLLINATGKKINTADLKGKVLFINFWATSCVPCMMEMPSINQLYTHYLNDTNMLVLSIDVDDNFTSSVSYMNDHNFSLPVYNTAGSVPSSYFRGILPTTLLIDKKGQIAQYYEEGMDYSSKGFIDVLNSLLRQ